MTQLASAVLMIRPVAFHANPQTRASNAFQLDGLALDAGSQQAQALAEFEALAAALRAAGVAVHAFDDTAEPATPDAIFPNNWVSFHPGGRAVLFPMQPENRRLERRADVVAAIGPREVIDLSGHEAHGRFLEGTGSMVLDRVGRVAYACRSPRTDEAVLAEFCARLGYRAMAFDALGPDGRPIYHTNVLMSVGDGFAVACLEALPHAGERAALAASLAAGGREAVAIDRGQMGQFAGNMLALAGAGGQILAMSGRAERCLRADQRAAIARHAQIVAVDVPAIEDCAGGSVRCMLAEIFF